MQMHGAPNQLETTGYGREMHHFLSSNTTPHFEEVYTINSIIVCLTQKLVKTIDRAAFYHYHTPGLGIQTVRIAKRNNAVPTTLGEGAKSHIQNKEKEENATSL